MQRKLGSNFRLLSNVTLGWLFLTPTNLTLGMSSVSNDLALMHIRIARKPPSLIWQESIRKYSTFTNTLASVMCDKILAPSSPKLQHICVS